MPDLEIKTSQAQVTLSLKAEGDGLGIAQDRLKQIAPILEAVLLAEEAWADLGDAERDNVHRAFLAQDMVLQMTMHQALEQARILCGITDGSERIEDHGFPEFQDG
ncbi:hypothetical protein [Roseovarius nanhaiticus]|uniref:hypothetical protein n=1 Tax=Roseovarius nanhaiticus TaxID=573024 RepID=UPI0024909869|nr:hypothetical protein [Roseovarius nanhaiticus]